MSSNQTPLHWFILMASATLQLLHDGQVPGAAATAADRGNGMISMACTAAVGAREECSFSLLRILTIHATQQDVDAGLAVEAVASRHEGEIDEIEVPASKEVETWGWYELG